MVVQSSMPVTHADEKNYDVTKNSIANELGAINFSNIIGGPLAAVVKASFEMSMTTVSFIQQVAFHAPNDDQAGYAGIDITKFNMKGGSAAKPETENIALGDPIYVTFEFERPNAFGMAGKSVLKVPFLTMLPIPCLKIDDVTLVFNVKIMSMDSVSINTSSQAQDSMNDSVSTSDSHNSQYSSNYKSFWGRYKDKYSSSNSYNRAQTTNIAATVVNTKSSNEGHMISREYSLNVKVHASGTDIPTGMARILDILESSIKEIPVEAFTGKGSGGAGDLMKSAMGGGLGGGAVGSKDFEL